MAEYCDWLDVPKELCPTCAEGKPHQVGHTPGGAGLSKFGKGSTHPDSDPELDALLGPPTERRHAPAGSAPFEMKWGAKCDECGEWIPEGDEGRYRDDKIVHADGERCG